MILRPSVHLLPMLAAATVSCVLAVVAWQYREYTGTRPLLALVVATAAWAAARLFAAGTTDPAVRRVAIALAVLAGGAAAVAWCVYAVQYTGRFRTPTTRELGALLVVPLVTALAVATNEYHGIVWSAVDAGGLSDLQAARGPLWYLHAVYTYVLIGASAVIVLEMVTLSENVYRGQATAMAAAAAAPLFANSLYLTGATGALDLTPAAFTVSGAVLIGGVFRDQLLQAMPLAREMARNQVFDELSTGVIVLDETDRVVDCNPAARALADTTDGADDPDDSPVGCALGTAFPGVAAVVEEGVRHLELEHEDGTRTRHYDVAVSPLRRSYGVVAGRLITVEDVTERERRETRLERERNRIGATFDAVPHPVVQVRHDDDGPTVVTTNAAFEETFGYAEDAVAGESLTERIVPEEERADARALHDRLRTEGRVEKEVTRTRADGTERSFIVAAAAIDDGDGPTRDAPGSVHAYVDITERERRREELRQERAFIDQALDSLQDIFYHIGPDGTLERWNDRLPETTGRDDEAIAGVDPQELFATEHRDRIADTVERTVTKGSTTVEADLVDADGERVSHEFRTTRLHDADGGFAGLVGVGRDVSERKARERELRTFRRAVEQAGYAMYWTDTDGTIEYVNQAFVQQTGYDASEAVGATPALLDGSETGAVPAALRESARTGESVSEEAVNYHQSGGQYTVDRSVTPVYRDGEIDRLVVISADITERVRRDQHRSVLQRVLRHDLRNNLNEVLLATQMADEADGQALSEHLDAIQRTVEETLSLTEQVEQSRTLFERAETSTETVDIVGRVREHVATLQTEHPEVTVSTDLPDRAPVVTTDLVGRAIRNVLQNAVQHNDTDQPRVAVSVEHRPGTDEVVLSVADNGPGIPESEVAVLDTDSEEQLKHLSGFGLWFVNWVLSVSGGSLSFADNDPRGTVVQLVLPAARPLAAP